MEAFRKFIVEDWLFAIVLFGMSLWGIALVIWRLLLNMNASTDMNEFLPVFQAKLEKEGIDAALTFCKSRTDVIPRQLYAAGLETSRHGLAAMRRAMTSVMDLEIIPDLNFLLPSILAIGKIATMVGLLGTVISMINTFNAIQKAQGGGNVGAQAGAIGLALFATALGLMTAIPLVFSYVHFKAWIDKYRVKMQSATQKLLVLVQATKPPA